MIPQRRSAASTEPPIYTGVRHARLTHSMKQLTPALKTVLIELRYRLCDGESAPISNRLLARATGYGEGYVSVLVRQLAGETVMFRQRSGTLIYRGVLQPFIQRVWDADAGGFVITMLPPPELRPKQRVVASQPPIPTPPSPLLPTAESPAMPVPELIQLPLFDLDALGDHAHDPQSNTPASAPQSAETPIEADHATDPVHPSHDHPDRMQQQPGVDQPPPADFTLTEAWPLMLRGTPGYSHADYRRDRGYAATRQLREHPDHLICWAVMRGQPVYSAAALDSHAVCEGGSHAAPISPTPDPARPDRSPGDRTPDRRVAYPAPRRTDRRQRASGGSDAAGQLGRPGCSPGLADLPVFLRNTPASAADARSSIPANELPAFLRVRTV